MKTTKHFLIGLVLFQFSLLSTAKALDWKLEVDPPDSATVTYQVLSSSTSGSISNSGNFSVTENATVSFIITPKTGYKIASVKLNGKDRTQASSMYYFGPVPKGVNHKMIVKLEQITPTGTVDMSSSNATSSIPVSAPNGHYTGQINCRPYGLDMAVDSAGKVDAVGTVEGVTPAAKGGKSTKAVGANDLEAGGSLKTINGKPQTSLTGGTKGTIDGQPSRGTGSVTYPLEISSNSTLAGVGQGSGTENGTKYIEKAQRVEAPVDPNEATQISKDWGFTLAITEETNSKGKKEIFISGNLTLPNGDKTSFPKKKTAYSPRSGYSVLFSQGLMLDGNGEPILDLKGKPTKDKKSIIRITKMTFAPGAANPNAGKVAYKFLGQKGTGDLVEFLTP